MVKKPDYLCDLVERIQKIRECSDILVLMPQNTGYSWLGVKNATASLFPGASLELPHYYSNCLLDSKQRIQLGEIIRELKFSQLIFSGFLLYFEEIAIPAKKDNTALKVKVIYHGFLAELAQNDIQKTAFSKMIALRQSGVIDELGFVKKGLSLTVNKLYGFYSKEIILKNPLKIEIPKMPGINIGVMVNSSFRKNLHNMCVAALMVDESNVHVLDKNDILYIPHQERIIAHGSLQHDIFISLLSQMTINLHITFSEASGGQVCSESISQGVPCLSAYTSSFFDYDDYLKEKLIVQGIDDSWFIFKKIEEVMNDYDEISKRCIQYSVFLNQLSTERVGCFLGI